MPTLVIQMGHTGRPPNPGSVGTAGEQDFARAVGDACVRHLDRPGGWRVRTILADPPVDQYRGDVFVAIHCDGSTNPAVRGGSVGYQSPEGGQLAVAWKAAYVRRGWSGPYQPDNYTDNLHFYYGVRAAIQHGNRRAFIAECGHLTNPADRALLLGPGGHDRVALAIGDALGITTMEDIMLTAEQDRMLYNLDRLLTAIILDEDTVRGVRSLQPDGTVTTTDYALAIGQRIRMLIDRPPATVDTAALAHAITTQLIAAGVTGVTPDTVGAVVDTSLRAAFARAGTY